ncbi:MAG: CheR family methyltransferase [Alphaproteobacteria bacterium]
MQQEYIREFEFKDKDFEFIAEFVNSKTGIVISDRKKNMIYSRVARRLRALGYTRFKDYCDFLIENPDSEVTNLINAVTTNLTNFFREKHHFDHLKNYIQNFFSNKSRKIRFRIWSAGCSTGQEAYTIAMIINSILPNIEQHDIKILATDIDTNVLANAYEGKYAANEIQNIPKEFHKYIDQINDKLIMSDKLKKIINFKQLNLLETWPMKGLFDIIFCRNVVIYFDKETQAGLFNRYANLLVKDGLIYIGHSENLYKVSDRYNLVGKTIYQKKN